VRNLRVALAQISPRLGDVSGNLQIHLESIDRARSHGAGAIVFPELSLTGYVLRDQVGDLAETADGATLSRLVTASRDLDIVVGFVEDGPGHRFFNTAAYLSGGSLVHLHRKLYLPTYGLFEEGRDLAPGEVLRAFDTERLGRIGMLVCEDLWHATSAWLLVQDGAEVLFVLSSGPTRGAPESGGPTSVSVWRELARKTAQFQTAYVVYVNRVGYEDGLNFGGGSIVVDPFGRDVALLEPLEPGMVVAELRDDVLRRARMALPLVRDTDLELVARELARIRTERFGLPRGEHRNTREESS
jgi:predicted amidohydrolase